MQPRARYVRVNYRGELLPVALTLLFTPPPSARPCPRPRPFRHRLLTFNEVSIYIIFVLDCTRWASTARFLFAGTGGVGALPHLLLLLLLLLLLKLYDVVHKRGYRGSPAHLLNFKMVCIRMRACLISFF